MSAKVTFSGSGSLSMVGIFEDSNPVDDNRQTFYRVVTKVTVENSEVVTIKHGFDEFGLRSVRVINSTGVEVTHDTGVVSITRSDNETTVFTFGSDDAGDYTIVIEY